MTLYNYLVGASIAAVARAAQPGAVAPVKAPMRNLTWGQLNFIHTTDTHGWLGGHFQEIARPQYSGDWGDFISFSHHMSAKADEKGADLLFVDTGDRIEGNGLYDASSPKGFYQYDIYAEHDVDIMSTGNHELYQVYSADLEHNTTTRNYPNNYIASNLDYIDLSTGDQSPMAPRFRKFTTKNQKIEVLAMGFIFDFTGNNKNTAIQPVRQTIKEEWFQKAIRERPDIFVIAGHVGLRMEEFGIIFTELRKADWDTPVVFFGGHAHVRDARKYDSLSIGMASGRYMETIGWMSVDGLNKKNKGEVSTQKSVSFHRKYIDNNLYGMYHHTGLNESTFPTAHGQNVSSMIDSARQALKLDHKYGCAPKNYWMSRAKHGSEDNLYTFIENEVFPGVVVNEERKDKPRLTIMNTGGIRFDIFKGPFTRDTTYIVSPFVSGFRYVPDVPYKIANNVIKLLNSGGRILDMVPENRFMAIPEQMFPSPLVSFTEDVQDVNLELRGEQKPLNGLDDETPLIGGLTTSDDIGDDGDDTIHEKLPFHPQPNAFQAKIAFPPDNKDPETVDLVFIDFVQPWIIPALKLSGGDYDDKDVEIYMEGTFTSKLSQWISDNWKGEC
ncbi:unnamed protein product [Clonostachys chloroleuca]|uniref:Putative 5'-nucleotidase C-terminal domain-containing protein n=1 Tax=Clonostachys chloroleuca TaxID=1926264 RepID=A0AA35MB35_9HYPO|nr:unnamed protein product [Clonostachys chloroleuca]